MPIHGYPGNVITANPTAPTSSVASGVWTTEQQLLAVSQGNWPGYEYPISRSLRFNSADSAYLNRTPTTPTSRKIMTFSYWVKRTNLTKYSQLWNNFSGATAYGQIAFNASDGIDIYSRIDGTTVNCFLATTSVYRDVSAWYHIVVQIDTTQATSSNRVRLYVNGSQVTAFSTATYPAQNDDVDFQIASRSTSIGRRADGGDSTQDLPAYLTEINMIDGQSLTPSSFGLNDPETGVWSPKRYTGTYGTNGFYLNFSDNSGTTSTTLGKDSSGNGNNWTPNNFSVTAGAGNDSLVDSPTSYGTDTGVGGEVRGNYATWNGVSIGADATLTNGNLDIAYGSSGTRNATMGTFGMSSGKWYWEVTITASSLSPTQAMIGITNNPSAPSVSNFPGFSTNGWGYYGGDGNKWTNGSASAYGASFTTNDVIGFAFDADAGSITAYKNGVSQGVMFSSLVANTYYPAIGDGASVATFSASANFGQRPFAYTAPSGFKALCTQNLPTPTIGATSTTQAGKYFNPVLYTGNGSTQSITGVGFQPDLVWVKSRSSAGQHSLTDVVRGVNKQLFTSLTNAEGSETDQVTAFNSDGFSLGANFAGTGSVNVNTLTYVAWNWKANGAGSSNTAGTITSTVSANTTSGFSIVTYTGTGSNATVGHGLGVAPSMIILKRTNSTNSWQVYHSNANASPASGGLFLNTTDAFTTLSTTWNNTVPTSTVFSIGTAAGTNASGGTYVAYCFAPVAGYSAFGSYTGNGSADGPFVYTGFRPRFILFKESSASGNDWYIYDAVRSTYNVATNRLFPNSSAAEATNFNTLDILSNGWKVRDSNSAWNASGSTYIYAAFAESPFKYSLAR